VLHLATHGFFLNAPAIQSRTNTRGVKAHATMTLGQSTSTDAMERSGLILAGGNNMRGDGENDGILTAREMASLDLRGTRLVVLSACETGLGDARRGQGVHGLRRAISLAGAESQVISLWQVSDDATEALMTEFYRGLHNGLGRSQALRRVRLHVRSQPQWSHPFFWAAFIFSGQSTTLDGQQPPAIEAEALGITPPESKKEIRTLALTPDPRGCGCQSVRSRQSTSSRSGVIAALMGLCTLWFRRRRMLSAQI